jgi:hypothetical protein
MQKMLVLAFLAFVTMAAAVSAHEGEIIEQHGDEAGQTLLSEGSFLAGATAAVMSVVGYFLWFVLKA